MTCTSFTTWYQLFYVLYSQLHNHGTNRLTIHMKLLVLSCTISLYSSSLKYMCFTSMLISFFIEDILKKWSIILILRFFKTGSLLTIWKSVWVGLCLKIRTKELIFVKFNSLYRKDVKDQDLQENKPDSHLNFKIPLNNKKKSKLIKSWVRVLHFKYACLQRSIETYGKWEILNKRKIIKSTSSMNTFTRQRWFRIKSIFIHFKKQCLVKSSLWACL